MSEDKKRLTKHQAIIKRNGKWQSDAPGWVPHKTLELNADQFEEGARIVVYANSLKRSNGVNK
jgi:hypothetical protein